MHLQPECDFDLFLTWLERFERCSRPKLALEAQCDNKSYRPLLEEGLSGAICSLPDLNIFFFGLRTLKTHQLIKLHNWHLTFYAGGVSWMIFLGNLNKSE